MTTERIPLKTLMTNAEQNITSRDAYIQEAIETIVNAPLRDFIDRSCVPVNEPERMKGILNCLELPEAYLERPFKDLIYLILAYGGSEDEGKSVSAGNAIIQLAELAVNNNQYLYKN